MTAATVTIAAEPIEKGNSPWRDAWLRLQKNKLAVFGLWALVVIALACVAGPWVMHYGYEDQNLDLGASPPRSSHSPSASSTARSRASSAASAMRS